MVRNYSRVRRSRRRAQIRLLRRRMTVIALAVFSVGLSVVAFRSFVPSWFRASSARSVNWQQAELSRNHLLQANQEEIIFDAAAKIPAYPYSVVPGGIQSGADLKRAAERDPVIAAHYAGFDYDHARVVRLTLAKTVFLSYRVGNHVYWTRHRVTLHPGETVITDGRKTARSKCGNRVEDAPQQATSPEEPPAEKFDQPAHPATAVQGPPAEFQSSLFNRPGPPGMEPGPPSLISPGGGGWVPIFPPVLGGGLCGPLNKGDHDHDGDDNGGVDTDHDGDGKKKGSPCGPPTAVPEPGTYLLLAGGLAVIAWRVRNRSAIA